GKAPYSLAAPRPSQISPGPGWPRGLPPTDTAWRLPHWPDCSLAMLLPPSIYGKTIGRACDFQEGAAGLLGCLPRLRGVSASLVASGPAGSLAELRGRKGPLSQG